MISRASMSKQLTGDRMPTAKGRSVFGGGRARSGGFASTGTDAGDLAVLRSAKNIDDGPSRSSSSNSTSTSSGMKKGGKVKKESRVNESGNYTKPTMRKRLFNEIKAGGKGGAPGQWSARKAQMLAKRYKGAGGGYKS
jgi:hypothetical protein